MIDGRFAIEKNVSDGSGPDARRVEAGRGRCRHPRAAGVVTAYDVPPVIQVEADGPIRLVRLNRPEELNATNHELHRGLAELFPQIDADDEARAVVLTGNGRAFSAGGDFTYLNELTKDAALRRQSLTHGKQIVT